MVNHPKLPVIRSEVIAESILEDVNVLLKKVPILLL